MSQVRVDVQGVSERSPIQRQSPAGIDFVWSEGVRLIDAQLRQAADLDSKASTLIGFLTAILALIAGQRQEFGEWTWLLVVELVAALALLLLAFRLQRFANAPALPRLALWAESVPSAIRDAFMDNLLEAYAANETSLLGKARYLRFGLYAIMLFGISAASLLLLRSRSGA